MKYSIVILNPEFINFYSNTMHRATSD